MDKVKAILLNGSEVSEIFLDKEDIYNDINKILGTNILQRYFSFGIGYSAFWQEERCEKTSMEITMKAGAPYPMFIDSKVIIINEDDNGIIDVDIDNLKQHFNTKNQFWALERLFISKVTKIINTQYKTLKFQQ